MDEVPKKTEKIQEPSFRLNYATVILLLVIIIPLAYTIWVNVQDVAPDPKLSGDLSARQVPPVQQNTAAGTNAAQNLVNAQKAVAEKPEFQSYINLGLAYYAVDSVETAIHSWQQALTYNPKSALTYNNIAAAYGKLNKYDEEIDACRKAIEIDSGFTLAKNNLAWAMSQKMSKK
jgi:tetratricopeptide (TPR) repeat protein